MATPATFRSIPPLLLRPTWEVSVTTSCRLQGARSLPDPAASSGARPGALLTPTGKARAAKSPHGALAVWGGIWGGTLTHL